MRLKWLCLLLSCTLLPLRSQESAAVTNPNDPELLAWTPSQSPIIDDLHDIEFYGDQKGWAYTYGTGTLIHTVDGGQTWQVLYRFPGHESGFFFEQIQFLNEYDGWIIGDYGHVYRTRDGGQSWKDVSPAITSRLKGPAEGAQGVRVLYYAMHFNSWKEGLISGVQYKQDEPHFKEFLLSRTSDGGLSWHKPARYQPTMMLNMVFTDERTGFATSEDSVWKTRDHGRTWVRSFSDSPAFRTGQLRGLFCLNSKTVFACGFDGKVARSTNGGNSWDVATVTTNRLRSLVFTDPNHGYAVGDKNKTDGVLYASNDGGATWRMLPFELPNLHRLTLSPSRVWAVGKKGTIISRSR